MSLSCPEQAIQGYFDEKSENCNNCDNCLNPPALIDGTILAQKLLSTIYRTGQFFGQVHIINVLRGSEDKKVFDKGHQNLSVFLVGFGNVQVHILQSGVLVGLPLASHLLSQSA